MLITILLIIILIFSAILHEYAHGAMARRLGDDTAEREGRLTLNPFKHLDPIGSVALPIILVITNSPFFLAWAKPVPYNPYNLRDKRFGELKVAAAGPLTNIVIAAIAGIVVRAIDLGAGVKEALFVNALSGNIAEVTAVTEGSFLGSIVLVALLVCFMNLMLALFNLVPVPPLDGSKIVSAFLPGAGREMMLRLERYGFIILLLLIMTGVFSFVFPLVLKIMVLFAGLG